MKIIIAGIGKVGKALVETFIKEGHDVSVIDQSFKNVDEITGKFDVKGVVGGCCESGTLLSAGVDKADFFISCTSRDEVNILSCVMAKRLGAERTVARVRDPEYYDEVKNIRERLDLDYTFNPEHRTAIEISKIFKFPYAKSVESFADRRAFMVEFEVESDNPAIGMAIVDVIKKYQAKVLFGIVQRGEQTFIPKGDFILKEGDNVHVIGSETEIAAFAKKMKIYKSKGKSAFIIGGGKIGFYLAKELLSANIRVKIMESDEEKCIELAGALNGATVLCGDGTDTDVLEEENLKNSDACITLTGVDEQNVIVALYAQQRKVGKVIAKIEKESMLEMVETLGLDTVFCTGRVNADHVLRFVRAFNTSGYDSSVNKLYKLSDDAEALDFTVGEAFPHIGQPIKNLRIRANVLIGGIIRNGEFILPGGDTEFKAGDRVIVVTKKRQINELTQIIK